VGVIQRVGEAEDMPGVLLGQRDEASGQRAGQVVLPMRYSL
jgi:hypothetical protein